MFFYLKNKFKVLKRNYFFNLISESELNKSQIAVLLSLTILLTLSEFIFLSLIAIFTNAILNGTIPNNLFLNNNFFSNIFKTNSSILILLIISFFFKSSLQAFKTFYISRLNGILRKGLRIKLMNNFLNDSKKSGIFSGKVFDMYFNSASASSKVIINFFDLIINIFFTLTALFILFSNFSFELLTMIILIGILYLGFLQIIRKYSDIFSKRNQVIFQDISQKVSEILKGYREIQIYGIKNRTISNLYKSENKGVDIISKSVFLNGLPSLVPAFILLCVIIFASLRTNNFDFSEQAPDIIILLIFVQRCGNFLGIIGSKVTTIRLSKAHVKHLLGGIQLNNSTKKNKSKEFKIKDINSIKIENLNFNYDKDIIFNRASTEILPNKINIISGKSGSGKSTFFSILLKENEIDNGRVFINKKDLNLIDRDSLYKIISFIPQNPYIFSASIYENILIAKSDASKEDIINATKFSGAYNFIKSLPNGFETILSEAGINLSGGQRQLISISRAFLSDSKIVLLDEPTNNLDKVSIKKLKNTLEKWRQKNKLILINTHDNELMSNDYQIYEIKNKKINKYPY